MRIHTDHSDDIIGALAAAIDKDPSSLESWRCLHIASLKNKSETWVGAKLAHLEKTHAQVECEVVQSADQDLFFLSRHLPIEDMYKISDDFIRATDQQADTESEVALYDVFHDWRIVRSLLLSKFGNAPATTHSKPEHAFSDIEALQASFVDAAKRRRIRVKLQVLVVEDDPLTQRLVSNAFQDDYEVITAATAQDAVTQYLLQAPDIVFLDIGLPDASGFDVLQQIMVSDPHAYVVMLSGNSYLKNVTAALSSGASGFVAKPFKKDKMRHYIQDSAMHHLKPYT